MKHTSFKQAVPHLAALALFLLIVLIQFKPAFEGKSLQQGDITNFTGMSKEIADYRKKTGEEALWTNSMFGGMPAWQISVLYPSNLVRHVDSILRLGLPYQAGLIFLCMAGFYFLLITLRFDPWLSAAGALAFAFSSYFFIIIEAGHNSKAHAIAYMAPVAAGILMTYRGKLLQGGIITALFLALELNANHLQITYYLALTMAMLAPAELYTAIRRKTLPAWLKQSGVLAAAALLAAGCNITSLWATYEYGKYTTRGPSELTMGNSEDRTSGLDKGYATDWSYGVSETMTLMIPNFKGGETGALGNNAGAMKNVDAQYRQMIAQQNQYWGGQPFTSGPVYAGAVVCFLFVLGLFLVQGPLKWWLLSATVLSIALAWGRNFMALTELFLDYFPGYNKFRAVSMTLVIAGFTMPLLAALCLKKIAGEPELLKKRKKPLWTALALTGGLCLVFYLAPGAFTDLMSEQETEAFYGQMQKEPQYRAQIEVFLANLGEARKSILSADAGRSFLFIALAAALLWLFSRGIVPAKGLAAGIALLVLTDLWQVNWRYLNYDNFVSKQQVTTPFRPTTADLQILQDKDPNFRVYNTTRRLDQDSHTSYFHKSLGGYHGAKLKRYQELITYQIAGGNMNIVNMLNAKYFIVEAEGGAEMTARANPGALGNAWFVDDYRLVENADSELTALSNFDPSTLAVVDKRFGRLLAGFDPEKDPAGDIRLTSYAPNKLIYNYKAATEQLAVFSEIYYDKGWNAYVDGKPAPHFRCNYVLRAMRLPAGEHRVEFRFEPVVYRVGESVSMVCGILLFIAVGGGIVKEAGGGRQEAGGSRQ